MPDVRRAGVRRPRPPVRRQRARRRLRRAARPRTRWTRWPAAIGHRIHPVLADPVLIAQLPRDVGRGGRQPAGAAARANPRTAAAAVEDLLVSGIPVRRRDDDRPHAHRRPAPLRGLGRCLRPPPHGGHAGHDPPPRRHARHRRLPPLNNEDDPGHDLRDPARRRSGSGSRPSTSSTPRTPSPVSAGSASMSPCSGGRSTVALRPIPHEMPVFASLGTARLDPVLHRTAPRPGPRDRPDRVRQVDHAGVAHRHHQPDQAAAHRDGRGPHRVPPRPQELDHHPARDRRGHRLVRRGAPPGAAPGPRRHPGRRAPRPRDDLDGADRRRDRPPGLRHPAHPGRARRRSTGSSTSSRPSSRSRSGSCSPRPSKAWSPSSWCPTADGTGRARVPRCWCARRRSGT